MAPRKGQGALVAALALLGLAGARGRLRRYEVAETSMEPALSPGNFLIAQSVNGPLRRGNIVVFPNPNDPTMELIKRVAGLPGETVTLSNGQVHIDGSVLAEVWADGPTRPDDVWELGPNEVFVLGDNRALSGSDSRRIGPIRTEAIAWKVTARYWPATSIGRL